MDLFFGFSKYKWLIPIHSTFIVHISDFYPSNYTKTFSAILLFIAQTFDADVRITRGLMMAPLA